MKNYIIGYGSLINVESQNITGKSLSSIPVILKNYKRSWSVTYDDLEFCAIGVYPHDSGHINVVLFEAEDLKVFDSREHGYNRVELDRSLLSPWKAFDSIPSDGKIWIYLPFSEKFGKPSSQHFIWQSYVDVILMGCLSTDTDFAKEFIKTTTGWDQKFFKNDRKDSAYLKALKIYSSESIDQLSSAFLGIRARF